MDAESFVGIEPSAASLLMAPQRNPRSSPRVTPAVVGGRGGMDVGFCSETIDRRCVGLSLVRQGSVLVRTLPFDLNFVMPLRSAPALDGGFRVCFYGS